MSQQEPAFYNLEFFGSAAFWDGAGDAARRAFLMPLPNPAEFLAFGVVGPSSAVHFVARGRVREHLGGFTAQMAQAGATVELYARPPLPWHLVKPYVSDEPYESAETDGPREPPVNGFMSYGGGADPVALEVNSFISSAYLERTVGWPVEDAAALTHSDPLARHVVLVKLGDAEVLAFGVCCHPVSPESYPADNRFVFVARVSRGEPLEAFKARMAGTGAIIGNECSWPSQVFLQEFLRVHFPHLAPAWDARDAGGAPTPFTRGGAAAPVAY